MPANIDALNYPYIRVRSADWLKRTLLIFPHVVRMTPGSGAPADDPAISEFTSFRSDREPLLRAANVHASHVHGAQNELVAELRHRLDVEGAAFRQRFGAAAARERQSSSIDGKLTVWERRLSPYATFQIHRYKLFDELVDFLLRENLAWMPDAFQSDGPDYLEMHPQLGEAVMATLAMACAENEGFQVVTEFPKLHGKLLGTPREKILTACLDGTQPNGETTGREVFEFLIYRRCNIGMLNAESIVALKGERDALADFRSKVEDLAKTLPATVFSEARRQELFDDILSDLFREWERDQSNMSSFARKFFGEGMLTESGKLVQKLVEAALKPETGQSVLTGATAGGLSGMQSGNLSLPVLTGAGAGFAVALVFHGFESWRKARDVAKNSPLRYLTKLQDQGVTFSVGR